MAQKPENKFRNMRTRKDLEQFLAYCEKHIMEVDTNDNAYWTLHDYHVFAAALRYALGGFGRMGCFIGDRYEGLASVLFFDAEGTPWFRSGYRDEVTK